MVLDEIPKCAGDDCGFPLPVVDAGIDGFQTNPPGPRVQGDALQHLDVALPLELPDTSIEDRRPGADSDAAPQPDETRLVSDLRIPEFDSRTSSLDFIEHDGPFLGSVVQLLDEDGSDERIIQRHRQKDGLRRAQGAIRQPEKKQGKQKGRNFAFPTGKEHPYLFHHSLAI